MVITRQKLKKRTILLFLLILASFLASGPAIQVFAGNISESETVVPVHNPPATPLPAQEPATAEKTKGKEPEITPDPTQGQEPAVTPEVTQDQKTAVTPDPTQEREPAVTQEAVQDEAPSVTQAPAQTETITQEVTAEPSPTPVHKPVYKSKTLQLMESYDYVKNSTTGVSRAKKDLSSLQRLMKKYGSLYGEGMPYEEYKEAMEYIWTDVTEYTKKPVQISVDLKKSINYKSYVDILKKLSRIEGVFLYKIGESTEGRDIYAIELDFPSDCDKNVILLTGQIHAREFGAGSFLLKQIVDLAQKAQTDEKTMELLKRNKYVAIPIINVDGREEIINSASQWTTKSGALWKAYVNGTDGNRNFPGLQWGQVIKGAKYMSIIPKSSAYANYPGPYAGSSKETKALMKFLYHYVVVEQASIYLDYHSQGSVIYAGKSWQTKTQKQRCFDLRTNILKVLNQGKNKRKYTVINEDDLYGLRGEGSSLTDYAVSLAVGAQFSPAYGFCVFVSDGKEYPLLQVKNLDSFKIKFKKANNKFAAITLEIGYGRDYLGNTAKTRGLLAKEYYNYNFDVLLEALPSMIKK